MTTLFYAKFLLTSESEIARCTKLAEAIHEITVWDAVLFLEPTVKFVQDGTRNEKIASDRKKYSDQIKELLKKYEVEYHCLDGDYLDRFVEAKNIIRDQLHIDTKW